MLVAGAQRTQILRTYRWYIDQEFCLGNKTLMNGWRSLRMKGGNQIKISILQLDMNPGGGSALPQTKYPLESHQLGFQCCFMTHSGGVSWMMITLTPCSIQVMMDFHGISYIAQWDECRVIIQRPGWETGLKGG